MDSELPNPITVLFEQARARAAEIEKMKAKVENALNTINQRLRLDLTAAADDVTSPLTERDFIATIAVFYELSQAINEKMSLAGRGLPHLVHALRALLKWNGTFITENPCQCPACAGE